MGEGRQVMSGPLTRAKAFLRSEDGATATEYAVMLGLVAAVVITSVSMLGEQVSATFSGVTAELPSGADGGTGAAGGPMGIGPSGPGVGG